MLAKSYWPGEKRLASLLRMLLTHTELRVQCPILQARQFLGGHLLSESGAGQAANDGVIRYGGCANPGPLLTPSHPFSQRLFTFLSYRSFDRIYVWRRTAAPLYIWMASRAAAAQQLLSAVV